MIGAQNCPDANGANAGTGRVYLVFGNFNTYAGQTVNLDTPASLSRTYHRHLREHGHRGRQLGSSVAGGVNIFGDGSADIIIGAPAATVDAKSTPVPFT